MPEYSHLTSSTAALLDAIADSVTGGSYSHLTTSRTQLLAIIANDIDGTSLSHLTTSEEALWRAVVVALDGEGFSYDENAVNFNEFLADVASNIEGGGEGGTPEWVGPFDDMLDFDNDQYWVDGALRNLDDLMGDYDLTASGIAPQELPVNFIELTALIQDRFDGLTGFTCVVDITYSNVTDNTGLLLVAVGDNSLDWGAGFDTVWASDSNGNYEGGFALTAARHKIGVTVNTNGDVDLSVDGQAAETSTVDGYTAMPYDEWAFMTGCSGRARCASWGILTTPQSKATLATLTAL